MATPVPRLVPDFFLYGPFKVQVYQNPARSLAVLKRNIRVSIQSVSQAALDIIPLRARTCLHPRGGHLKTVLAH